MTRTTPTVIAALAVLFAAGCQKADFIELQPDIVTLKQKNNMVWMRAMVKSHSGEQYPKATVGWSIKDPTIATVDETGRVTPLKSGRTEVVASYSGLTASVPVLVQFAEKMKVEPSPLELSEDGEAVDLKVTVFDHQGKELRDRSATFKSLDPKVLTMGQNAAHPGQAGETKVEVRVDALMEVVDVRVLKPGRKK